MTGSAIPDFCLRNGPDMAEFCSDYCAMVRDANGAEEYREWLRIPRPKRAREVAAMWAERALDTFEGRINDAEFEAAINAGTGNAEYYLP